jgi:hypothetical protein
LDPLINGANGFGAGVDDVKLLYFFGLGCADHADERDDEIFPLRILVDQFSRRLHTMLAVDEMESTRPEAL